MKYFSGKGDQGESRLISGGKITKGEPIFRLLGAIDELNSFIGLAICEIQNKKLILDLQKIQKYFSTIMGYIAGMGFSDQDHKELLNFVNWLENEIDQIGQKLEPSTGFTFPGINKAGARFDVCRTIARRVERIAVSTEVDSSFPVTDFFRFFNRISSYFFVLRLFFEQKSNSKK